MQVIDKIYKKGPTFKYERVQQRHLNRSLMFSSKVFL